MIDMTPTDKLMKQIHDKEHAYDALSQKLRNYRLKNILPIRPHPKAIQMMEDAYHSNEMEAVYDALVTWVLQEALR